MKNIFIILSLLLGMATSYSGSSFHEDITVIGKIQGRGEAMKVIRSLDGNSLSGIFESPNLAEEVLKLREGDDVVIKGYVTYEGFKVEGISQLKPVFVIQSLKPISLSRISEIDKSVPPRPINFLPAQASYSPFSIPVTTQVASSITLTSSMLLLQSLTNGPNDPLLTQQLNSGLVLFAGALFTGVFIYEQLINAKKSKELK